MNQKRSRYLVLAAVLLLGLSACRKQDTTAIAVAQEQTKTDRVIQWIGRQTEKYARAKDKATLGRLKNNLLLSGIQAKEIAGGQKLIVVPIADSFVTAGKTSNTERKWLVIRSIGEEWAGGFIAVLDATTPISRAGMELIAALETDKPTTFSGSYRVLGLHNSLLIERKYENGRLSSLSHITKKKPGASQAPASPTQRSSCIDWYLVTTYYYEDGTTEEVWEYAFTICDEDGGEGGGGGAGGFEGDEDPADPNAEEIYLTAGSEEEDMNGGAFTPEGVLGAAPKIYYFFDWKLIIVNDEITNVVRGPVRAEPMISNYIDGGWNTTRTLNLFSQYSSYTLTSPLHGWVSWSWYTGAHYVYHGTTETHYRMYPKTHSSVF